MSRGLRGSLFCLGLEEISNSCGGHGMRPFVWVGVILIDSHFLSRVPLVDVVQVQVRDVEAFPVFIELLMYLGVSIVLAEGMNKGKGDDQ